MNLAFLPPVRRAVGTFRKPRGAFTLIEIILAMAAAALLMAAIYAIFSKAIHLRNNATVRERNDRTRSHAAQTLLNDLRNAIVSGGTIAAYLQGSNDTRGSNFPGYLTFTTTTARDSAPDEVGGDVQQVEYYIVNDPDSTGATRSGLLVRTVDRNILASPRDTAMPQNTLLAGVTAMEVTFYNGTSWVNTWTFSSTDNPTLPEAVQVILRLAPPANGGVTPPITVLVPWGVQNGIDFTPTTNT